MSLAALVALAGMGAFHGLNPGMGWLFAVAIGLQERRRSALARALGPIAAGHAASVFLVAGLVGASLSVLAGRAVAITGGIAVVGFGVWRALSTRHLRWAGFRLSAPQLAGWSFLMSSVHGAGLMLLPVLVASGADTTGHAGTAGTADHAGSAGHAATAAAPLWYGLAATAVHTLAMAGTAALVAFAVFEVFGLRILRTAWINLDRIWAVALVGAGIATVALGITS